MLAFLWPLFHDAISPHLNPLPEGEEDIGRGCLGNQGGRSYTGRGCLGNAGRETVGEAPGEGPHSLVRYSRLMRAPLALRACNRSAQSSTPRIIRCAW